MKNKAKTVSSEWCTPGWRIAHLCKLFTVRTFNRNGVL